MKLIQTFVHIYLFLSLIIAVFAVEGSGADVIFWAVLNLVISILLYITFDEEIQEFLGLTDKD